MGVPNKGQHMQMCRFHEKTQFLPKKCDKKFLLWKFQRQSCSKNIPYADTFMLISVRSALAVSEKINNHYRPQAFQRAKWRWSAHVTSMRVTQNTILPVCK